MYMDTQEILKEALRLSPSDKSLLIDGLLTSLDEPDLNIDSIWKEEIERRVAAYRDGRVKTIPYNGHLKD